MNRRIFALTLGVGLAAFIAPRIALAEDHLAEAISCGYRRSRPCIPI